MFGLFRGIRPSGPTFERLLADAEELRDRVSEQLEGLSGIDRLTVLSTVQDLSRQMQQLYAVPLETLPFGTIHDVSFEQATMLVDELDSFYEVAEQHGNELAALASAYLPIHGLGLCGWRTGAGQRAEGRVYFPEAQIRAADFTSVEFYP
jgi:hypothetical protein